MKDNQHFVSKAYLDKFVHPTSRQNVLHPYAKGHGALRPTGTRHLASDDHFYHQVDAGELTNKLDEARKVCETMYFASGKRITGPLAKCIFDDNNTPSMSDKIMLAGAAAFLHGGAPVQVHNTAMMLLLAYQQYTFNRMNTPEVKEEYLKRYGDAAEQRLDEDRELLWKGKIIVDVGEENWKQLGFNAVQVEQALIDALCLMGLTVCYCHPTSCFITSDNPVIITCHSQKDSPGLCLKDAEVWFSISHKKGLLWTWKHRAIDRTTLGHSATRVQNRNMIRWCYKEVYAPLPEPWIESAVKQLTFDPCYGYYGSLEQVAEHNTIYAFDQKGVKHELVDTLAALRDGEKCDVLRLKRRFQLRQDRQDDQLSARTEGA
jgi:hypothetical protein